MSLPGEPVSEALLLASLREHRGELEALLAACSDHWGYEDPVYRFYHQSLKVYALQDRTSEIFHRLEELLPENPLDPWFVEIVREGTAREFEPSDNRNWLAATAPILTAFFHARFFLQMAVRYAALDSLPRPLPSGYAALLCLYGIR